MKIGNGQAIEGDNNLQAGRDITITNTVAPTPSPNDFDRLDEEFRRSVSASQTIFRAEKPVQFTSEGLFTSLMRIGVSYKDAWEITARVIQELADLKENSSPEWQPTTGDIRNSVMTTLSALGSEKNHSTEQTNFWFAAYIRRYGTPINDCIKVIDHDQLVDLNHEFITETLLPHLFSRIIGLDRTENPLERYATTIFPRQTRDQMTRAVLSYTRELNLYSIRYKTLIHLLQDLILEPPHPWIVNGATQDRVTRYNVERALAHYRDISGGGKQFGFEYSAKECLQHLGAALLSKYGCFLGVDYKYGLFELRRILKLKAENCELWDCCAISRLPSDLKASGVDVQMFNRLLESARNLWHLRQSQNTNDKLLECAKNFMKMATPILSEYFPDPDA